MHLQTDFDHHWSGVSDDQTTNIGGQNGVLDHQNDNFDCQTSNVGCWNDVSNDRTISIGHIYI